MFPSWGCNRCTETSSLFWQHWQTQRQARSCTSSSTTYSNSSLFSLFAYKVIHFYLLFRSRLEGKLWSHFQISLRAKNEYTAEFLLCHDSRSQGLTLPCRAILQEVALLRPGALTLLLSWLKQSWRGEGETISRPPSDGGQPGSEVEGSAVWATDASHDFWVLWQ